MEAYLKLEREKEEKRRIEKIEDKMEKMTQEIDSFKKGFDIWV
jgi:hypothetical protein